MIAHLLRHELRLRLYTPAWWLLGAGIWLVCAWMLFAQLQVYQEILPQLNASGSGLGVNTLLIGPVLNALALLLLAATPLLGMSTIAGERRSGRLAAILATPAGTLPLLLGKWLGLLLSVLLLASLVLAMLASLGAGMQLDWGRMAVATLGLLMLIGLSAAVTLAWSSFTRNPGAAFAGALLTLLLLWLGDSFTQAGSSTHWFTLGPHLAQLLQGTLGSDELAYFLLLTGAALVLALVGLLREREAPPLRPLRELTLLVLLALVLIGGALQSQTHRHTLYRAEPLPQALADTLVAIQGPVNVTAWAPDYPILRARIEKLLRPLRELHPHLELRWIDPQREPQLARELGVTHEGELHIEAMGRSQRVQQLDQRSLLRALRHIARRGEPWIVALSGHGEAPLNDSAQGIGAWISALDQYGYRVVAIDATSPIPDNAALVLVAAPKRDYAAEQLAQLQEWLQRGGSLLWLQEAAAADTLTAVSGIGVLTGSLVSPLQRSGLSPLQLPLRWNEGPLPAGDSPAILDQAQALTLPDNPEWQLVAGLRGADKAWNETGALRGEVQRNALQGERSGPHLLGLLLRKGEARMAILGDSDLARNSLFGQAGNSQLLLGLVNWLTGNRLDTSHVADDSRIDWSPATGIALGLLHLLLGPLLFLGTGLWLQRRRRQG